jgi:hypothetical protein
VLFVMRMLPSRPKTTRSIRVSPMVVVAVVVAVTGSVVPGRGSRAADVFLSLSDEPASVMVQDERLPFNLLDAEPVPTPAGTDLLEVSAQAIDGMRIEEFEVGVMPPIMSSGRWFWNGGWYANAEGVWLDRTRNNRRVVAVDQQVSGAFPRPPVVYTSAAQQFDIAPGARVTIGRSLGRDYLDRDRSLEFVWYGGFQWQDNDGWNALPDGRFITPLDPFAPGFNGSTRYTTQTTTDFNSFEVNYRLRRRLGRDKLVMSPNGTWTRHAERAWLSGLIVGGRIGQFNEKFAMQSSIPGVTPDSFGGDYRISATTTLLGLNVGGELISQNEFYYWGVRGRAAPCVSYADQSQSARGVLNDGVNPPLDYSMQDSGSQNFIGFLGDMSLLAGWNITPNVSVQAGWEFLWLAGLATAERQFDLDNTEINYIDAGGQVFAMGLSIGLCTSW